MITLPLFPLPMTACPRELVPLHIFEERYKDMIRSCRDRQEQGGIGEFIIAFSRADGLSDIGTVVRLVKVIKEYDDGRMDILVAGRRRCRIREVPTEARYRCAVPDPFEDDKVDWNEALATEAFNLHRSLVRVVTGKAPGDEWYAGVAQISFPLAATISIGHEAKQRMLEMTSEDERLHMLIGLMSELMRHVEQVQVAARAMQGQWELEKIYGHGHIPR